MVVVVCLVQHGGAARYEGEGDHRGWWLLATGLDCNP